MTSQLESLIQQATQLERLAVCDSNRDERIELITHVANSLHSNNDPTSELTLTDVQQSQLNRLRSEIEIGLEQIITGDTVDGETVFANLRTRIDSYRTTDSILDALPLQQENLVAAIWSPIDSPVGEATPTIY